MKLVLNIDDSEEVMLRRTFPHYFMPNHHAEVRDSVHGVLRELLYAAVDAFRRERCAVPFPLEATLKPKAAPVRVVPPSRRP